MSDKELSKAFGTSAEEIEADVESFESGDWSDFKFGKPIDGRPQAKMKTTSLKFYDFELAAIDAAAKKEGISRLDEVTADDLVRYRSDDDGFAERFVLYLKPTKFIDFGDERVAAVARSLKSLAPDRLSLVRTTYEYVRDRICHSYDARLHAPAAKASEVLEAGGSICWGKANLLAALLRANGIPSGISYQVLTKGDAPESGYMVHALNTVYADVEHGWVRLDARGNKEGVDAQFSLDGEKLAYAVRPECGERDFNDNHADADSELMRLIAESDDILTVSSDAVLDRWIRPL